MKTAYETAVEAQKEVDHLKNIHTMHLYWTAREQVIEGKKGGKSELGIFIQCDDAIARKHITNALKTANSTLPIAINEACGIAGIAIDNAQKEMKRIIGKTGI